MIDVLQVKAWEWASMNCGGSREKKEWGKLVYTVLARITFKDKPLTNKLCSFSAKSWNEAWNGQNIKIILQRPYQWNWLFQATPCRAKDLVVTSRFMCVSGSCVLAEVINTGSVPRDALSCLWEHSTGDITRRSRGASFQFFVLVLEV